MAHETRLDPVAYEVFAHRLWAIGEEGRIALQRVTASPIVAQGGECMCSFYDTDGRMILACSGHLRFASATSDAIRRVIEWYQDDPGIFEGDEFFFNDPYVAGSHTYDVIQMAPVFHDGHRIGWVASSSHTADTGGVLRGQATEIYHEGIRILGLKIVDRGIFRQDVFRTIVEQCRDPHYVGLDLKSRTAANSVCARGLLRLVEELGVEFVDAAGRRLIEDSERLAREKLRRIPDGTWRSRIYGSARNAATNTAEPYQVVCTATKTGDQLVLDFDGSSAQLGNDQNSTLPSTTAHVAIALTNQLFWDVPWSDGKMAPVDIRVPEGSALNCRFPAACGRSPRIGQYVVEAVRECLSRMLFAAGIEEDVNASWGSFWYLGGPGFFYGGHNARGLPNPQGLYDIHGGGMGAAPLRDGVNTGGQSNIPSGGISDVERIELQYPFVYFTRRHNPDGGGAGRWNGGNGSARLLMVHGSRDLSVDHAPYGGLPQGAFGLFGGYPAGTGGMRAVLEAAGDLPERLQAGGYPIDPDDALADGWAETWVPPTDSGRIRVAEGWLVSDFTQGGGGYGDPLDREPVRVADDVARRLVTHRTAELLHGVVLRDGGIVDDDATEARRHAIREERRSGTAARALPTQPAGWELVLPYHALLELGRNDSGHWIRCSRCHTVLSRGDENPKLACLRRDRDLSELSGRALPDGSPHIGVLREYACPGCATLVQVDVFCPSLGGEEDLWDTRIEIAP
ncbi:MAG: hydantoinase B/oxoprolinase family protein [Chloroflexota bacterium]